MVASPRSEVVSGPCMAGPVPQHASLPTAESDGPEIMAEPVPRNACPSVSEAESEESPDRFPFRVGTRWTTTIVPRTRRPTMPRRIWNLTEIRTIAENYPEEGPEPLARLLGRSEDSVMGQARRFGIRSLHRRSRQGQARALRSTTVNPRFFEAGTADVAYVLGVLSTWGSVKENTRHVLRIRAPIDREAVLETVLAKMGSRHIQQRGRRRILVEVGNSRLVASLVGHHGRLPGRHEPDPPVPAIVSAHTRAFARGLLDAAGEIDFKQARWLGSARATDVIRHTIASTTGHDATDVVQVGRRKVAVWKGVIEVLAIRRWLAVAGVR